MDEHPHSTCHRGRLVVVIFTNELSTPPPAIFISVIAGILGVIIVKPERRSRWRCDVRRRRRTRGGHNRRLDHEALHVSVVVYSIPLNRTRASTIRSGWHDGDQGEKAAGNAYGYGNVRL